MELTPAGSTRKSTKSAKPAKKTVVAKAPPRDICAEITAKLVEQLEKGVAPWIQPWSGDGGIKSLGGLPRNALTGKTYHGANILVLWSAGFSDPRWLTFQQALTLGGFVRKGEKGQTICWWSPVSYKDKEDTETKEDGTAPKTRLVCRSYTVFNVSQCDGLKLDGEQEGTEKPEIVGDIADKIAEKVGAKVIFGGDEAKYSPVLDRIKMPIPSTFKDIGAYNSIFLHELTHWTGHPTRCNREFGKRFGNRAYAFEELVAEIGSAFACARLGITGTLQHAEYLQEWASVLKGDKHAIFTAAREAEKACNLLVPEEAKDAEESEESE